MKVAVIPARGGSKRIPRKNLRQFAGKPMIAHSIERALESALFDRVIVSTDDEEIAEVAKVEGAEAPFRRPSALADDDATTLDVMQHAVAQLQANGPELEAVCCIYATAPFLRSEDLARGLECLLSGNWLYAFAAARFCYPVFRSFSLDGSGGVRMLFTEHLNTRSQDLPETLHDAGQFYWGRPQAWIDRAPIFGGHSTVVRIPAWRVQDIDTPEDWRRAELMARVLQEQRFSST